MKRSRMLRCGCTRRLIILGFLMALNSMLAVPALADTIAENLIFGIQKADELPKNGDNITIDLTIDHVDGDPVDRITGVSVGLLYDDTILRYTGRSVDAGGDFIWSTQPVIFLNRRENPDGEVLYFDMSEFGSENFGTGPGTLLRLHFEVVSRGISPLDFVGINTFGNDELPSIALLSDEGQREVFIRIDSEDNFIEVGVPDIVSEPASVDFGIVQVDSTAHKTLRIINTGTSRLDIQSPAEPSSPFSFNEALPDSFTIPAGESREIPLRFRPTSEDASNSVLAFEHDGEGEPSPIEISLSGAGEFPGVASALAPADTVVRTDSTLRITQTITNTATETAVLAVQLTGLPEFLDITEEDIAAPDGAVVPDDDVPLSLQLGPQQEAVLTYSFQQDVTQTTEFSGEIILQSSDPANPEIVTDVNVTAKAAELTLLPEETIPFGDVPIFTRESRTLEIINTDQALLQVRLELDEGPFTIGQQQNEFELGFDEATEVTLHYDPVAPGDSEQQELRVIHDGHNTASPTFLTLTGNPFTVGDVDFSSAVVPDGTSGEPTLVSIRIEDAHGNKVPDQAQLIAIDVAEGPNEGTVFTDVSEQEDSTYTTRYVPLRGGTDLISIAIDGEMLAGSPFPSNIESTLSVTADEVPDWVVNQPGFEVVFEAEGGTPPYVWSIDTGRLADGLALDQELGVISGAPLEAGLFELAVRATDANDLSATAEITVRVDEEELRARFVSHPVDGTMAGEDLGTVEVEIRNQNNIVASWYQGDLTLSITEGTGRSEDEDVSLFGQVTREVEQGRAVYDGLFIERSGLRYSLDADAANVVTGVSNLFTVLPGEPFALDLQELDADVDTLMLPEVVRLPDNSDDTQASLRKTNGQGPRVAVSDVLEGSRIPIGVLLRDQFGNLTLFDEGDTFIGLGTDSETGSFFLTPTDIEPLADIIIPPQQQGNLIFYEDPSTGEPDLSGEPGEREDAREITPASRQVTIRNAENLLAQPDLIETEVNTRERVQLTLTDRMGERVNAPYPGVLVQLESSSSTGRFFALGEGGDPITEIRILPTATRTNLYYEQPDLGQSQLTLTGGALLDGVAMVTVVVSQGAVDPVLSEAETEDGFVDDTTRVFVTLRDNQGRVITDRADEIVAEITDGPNTGAGFSDVVHLGEGRYQTSYVPGQPGIDRIVVTAEQTLADMPLESRVTAILPSEIALIGANQRQGRILQELDEPVTVRISDTAGNPMSDIPVRFRIAGQPAGAEQTGLETLVTVSAANGEATTRFTPGTRRGIYLVEAVARGLDPVEITITADGCTFSFPGSPDDPCAPYELVLSAEAAEIPVGESVAVAAQLRDGLGNDVAFEGLDVVWSHSADGSFAGEITRTDSDGVARNTFTGSAINGTVHIIRAQTPGNELQSGDLSVTVRGSDIADLGIDAPDTVRVGLVSRIITVTLRDADGNEIIAPEDLAFRIDIPGSQNLDVASGGSEGDLSLSMNRRVTITEGASRGYLTVTQEASGPKQIEAVQVRGVQQIPTSSVPIFFRAEDPRFIDIVSGNEQTAAVGEPLEDPLRVVVTDRFNNLLPDVAVRFQVTEEPGGFPTGVALSLSGDDFGDDPEPANPGVVSIDARTNNQGVASAFMRTGTLPGNYVVMARTDGTPEVTFQQNAIQDTFALLNAFPNPFRAESRIRFIMASEGQVTITVYDAIGRRVDTLARDRLYEEGLHEVLWDARRLANGTYIYLLEVRTADGEYFRQSHAATVMNH